MILAAAFPNPSARLISPAPAAPFEVILEFAARPFARLIKIVITIGEEYWASMSDASSPGRVEVRPVSRARRSLGELKGVVGLDMGDSDADVSPQNPDRETGGKWCDAIN